MRLGISILSMLAVMLLSASHAWSAGDPAVDGKDYLLPASELRALLVVARKRVAQVAPWSSISRVRVVSAAKVETYFRAGAREETYPPSLTLERLKGQWRITDEDIYPHVIFDH